MNFAQDSGQLSAEFDPFADDYLGEIVESIVVAWSRIKRLQEIENRITNKIVGRIKNDPAFRDLPFDVVPQYSLFDIEGTETGRIDIYFKHRRSHRDYFAFEAKRLHVTFPKGKFSTEYSTYASEKGMAAFVIQQYSAGLSAAGMLGYVMDGNTTRAWTGLDATIRQRSVTLRMIAQSGLAPSSLSAFAANGVMRTRLGKSVHMMDTHQLRLLHLLLPVCDAETPVLSP